MEKMMNARFEVEKFNGKNNFELWKLKVWDLLVQQGLHKALDGKRKKPVGMWMMNGKILMQGVSTPFGCVWPMMSSSISWRGNNTRPMEQNGEPLHDEIPDQLNLLEEETV
jgi:hypothetical protein